MFQLQAPLAAWGDTAVGEYRGSYDYPGESALVGLLAAALGIRREDEAAHLELARGYGFAVGVQGEGRLLRDYHTAQVPGRTALKGRPHRTRRDELVVPKEKLHTVLSSRDYRQNVAYLVAVQPSAQSPYSLKDLAVALAEPRFTLYLGRKSCPLAVPLSAEVIAAPDARQAVEQYRSSLVERTQKYVQSRERFPMELPAPLNRLVWGERVTSGMEAELTVTRKDRLIRRAGWQFGDRLEHVALLAQED